MDLPAVAASKCLNLDPLPPSVFSSAKWAQERDMCPAFPNRVAGRTKDVIIQVCRCSWDKTTSGVHFAFSSVSFFFFFFVIELVFTPRQGRWARTQMGTSSRSNRCQGARREANCVTHCSRSFPLGAPSCWELLASGDSRSRSENQQSCQITPFHICRGLPGAPKYSI